MKRFFDDIRKQQSGLISFFRVNYRYKFIKDAAWLEKHYEKLAKARRDKNTDFVKKICPVKKDDSGRDCVLAFVGSISCRDPKKVDDHPVVKGRMQVSRSECKKCEHIIDNGRNYYCAIHRERNKGIGAKIWNEAMSNVKKTMGE